MSLIYVSRTLLMFPIFTHALRSVYKDYSTDKIFDKILLT